MEWGGAGLPAGPRGARAPTPHHTRFDRERQDFRRDLTDKERREHDLERERDHRRDDRGGRGEHGDDHDRVRRELQTLKKEADDARRRVHVAENDVKRAEDRVRSMERDKSQLEQKLQSLRRYEHHDSSQDRMRLEEAKREASR